MNTWARKTARLAHTGDYLDRLQTIYPVSPKARTIPPDALEDIAVAFQKRERLALLNGLLRLERFPYDESYAKFLRVDPAALSRNPKTVERMCGILFRMGWEKVVEGVTAPKKANTGRGHEFVRWARAQFKFVGIKAFQSAERGVRFLDAPDGALRNFANAVLGSGLAKRPDFIARTGKRHVIGEAKFLSDEGGNQRAAFRDAIDVAGHPSGRAVKVAVLDGIVWVKHSSFYKLIETSSVQAFSALLLGEFLESLDR